MSRRPRATFYTLGCKVNQAETRTFAEDLLRLGYRVVPFGQPADVCVVNTCSVTDQADVKSRSVLRRAGRSGDDPLVVATGCYADVAPAEVGAVRGVGLVVPNSEKPRLAEIVHDTLQRSGRLLYPLPGEDEMPGEDEGGDPPSGLVEEGGLAALLRESEGVLGRTRAVLKIQDGCNHFCSFCIIPYARGRLRSLPFQDALARARHLAREGYRELVLTGICLGDFGDERGFPRGDRDPLALLIEEMAAIPGVERLRLSSLDPADVSDDLIHTLGRVPQACPHLHLSLQAGDDEVLRSMRRRYDSRRFVELVECLYQAIPGLALTCDAIAGFPGETEAQFEATHSLCERARFVKIHPFPYSVRSGTLAARLEDDVPPSEKERRVRCLLALSRRQGLAFAERHVGEEIDVLVESRDRRTGQLTGLTPNYLRAYFDGPDSLRGEVVRLLATSAGEGSVFGEQLDVNKVCPGARQS